MNIFDFNKNEGITSVNRSAYYDYKLQSTKSYLYKLIIGVSIINLFLLIPDLALVESPLGKTVISIIRPVYSVILFAVSIKIKNIDNYKSFFITNSINELIALAIFLYVFSQYSQPNFLIQSMGLIILIIIVFLFPNLWANMMSIAVIGSIGFFICASSLDKSLNLSEYFAAVVYVFIAIVLCGGSAMNAEKHQYREFVAKSELERMSSTDFLTDTANRSKMTSAAENWITFCRENEQPLALSFIDVDDLKRINDVYGHSTGDSVLSNLAKLIQSELRCSDVLARWGGDEFVILMPNTSLTNAISFSERVETVIRETEFCQKIHATCTFGIVEMKHDSTFEALVSQADKLMYDGKIQGKDKICYTK